MIRFFLKILTTNSQPTQASRDMTTNVNVISWIELKNRIKDTR